MTARSSLLCLSLGGIQGSVLPEGKSSRFHGARETSGRRCDRHSDAVTLGRRIEVGSGGRKVSAQQHPSPKGGARVLSGRSPGPQAGAPPCAGPRLGPRQILGWEQRKGCLPLAGAGGSRDAYLVLPSRA